MAIATAFPRTVYVPTVEPTMKIPFVRHILRAGNVMPISSNLKGLVKFKKDCLEILQNKKVLHYFPEGALWPYYGKLREFKPGAFRFAIDANCPILPYCLYFRETGVKLNEGYELKSKWYESPINKKDKATNSLRVSCLFCIFKHSPQKTV